MEHINNCIWYFGDGTTTNVCEEYVSHTYVIGWFTVRLELDTDLGYITNIEKEYYIRVGKPKTSNFNADYSRFPVSMHYGFGETSGYGWSEFKGEHWVWPESRSSVTTQTFLGENVRLAWDIFDDKQYVLNSSSGKYRNVYRDKVYFDGTGGYPIDTEILLPEFNGASESQQIKHDITKLFFRDIKNNIPIPDGMEFDIYLYDSDKYETVDAIMDVNVDADIVFMYQNRNTESTNHRMIGITTNNSGYRFTGFESEFIVMDRDRLSSLNEDHNEEILSNPKHWFSRQYGHRLDRITGKQYSPDFEYVKGPDGNEGSAITLLTDFILNNSSFEGDVLFWKSVYDTNPLQFTNNVVFETVHTVDDWDLVVASGIFPENIVFPAGMELFDSRIFDHTLNRKTIDYYILNTESCLPIF